ncbi:MAG: SpoIID/LytB domain-containing protein, partial [Mycobacteriales bacterium]
VDGHGWGHGHGMSQWGAEGGAMQGASAAQITAFYYPGTTLGTVADSPVRVLLSSTDGVQVVVDASSGLLATDVGTGASRPLPATEAPRYRAVVDSAGLHLQEWAGGQWRTLTVGGRASLAGPVQFSVAAGSYVRVAYPDGSARDYRGVVLAVSQGPGRLVAVDHLPLEEYLLGVVPRESPSSWAPAALQAQAIAARSYAVYEARHAPPGQPWDICDSTWCQVFGGTNLILPDGSSYPLEEQSTTAAVQATAGQVRLYQGQPIFAQFSSSDGGWTVAGNEPYLIAQPDPWDGVPGEDVHSWTAQVPVSAIEAAFAGEGLGQLVDLRVTQRDGNGEWGGRVLSVVLDGMNAAGQPTQVTTTGEAIAAAYGWPDNASGLRSNWWHIRTVLDSALVGQATAPALVASPGQAGAVLTATVRNTGTEPWPAAGLALVPLGADRPSRPSGVLLRDETHPGASSVAPGDTALMAVLVDLGGRPPGTYPLAYRLTVDGGNPFGATVGWQVTLAAPVFSAAPVSVPVVTALPRTGEAVARLVFRNTGNVSWPVGGLVRLGTSLPRGRESAVAGPGWLSADRVAAVQAVAPGATSVPPGGLAAVDVPLAGHGKGIGPIGEGFELVWDGRSWLGGAESLLVVVTDPGAARSAVLASVSAPAALPADPLGTGVLDVRLVNTGAANWPVGEEPLTLSGAGAGTGRLAPDTALLAANDTVPGSGTVAPGEVGEWQVPLAATPGGRALAAGSYRIVVRAGTAGAGYGPAIPVSVSVTPAAPALAVVGTPARVVIPRTGRVVAVVEVRNTGTVALPVHGFVRTLLPAGVPFTDSSWPAPHRPGLLATNLSVPGASVLLPGQLGQLTLALSGNGTADGVGSLPLAVIWDGFARLPLSPAGVSVPYEVR